MTDRELQELLDARPDPAEAARALAGATPAARREAEELLALGRLAASAPRPAPGDAFAARVMDRVRARPAPRPSVLSWLLAPRLSRLHAAAAAAAGALAAALVVASVAGAPPPPAPAGPARMVARLALDAPGAHAVSVAGDFNGWKPQATPLRRGVDGRWSVEIPVEPGHRYEYMFVVDGAWLTDPAARAHADDGFGGRNAILDT